MTIHGPLPAPGTGGMAADSMPYGGTGMEGNSTVTNIVTVGVYELITGTFVASASLKDFTVSGSRLTYTGATDKQMHLVTNFDMTAVGNNKQVSARWFKNGVAITSPPVNRFISTGADQGAVSVHGDVVLSTGDIIDLRITNLTDSTDLIVENAYVFAMGMPV